MAHTEQAEKTVSDVDIVANIHHALNSYPPYVADRSSIHISSENGVVTVSGYTKSSPTYLYIVNRIADVPGVQNVIHDRFYTDEDIRLDVGLRVPPGLIVTVEYGTAILSGQLPKDLTMEDIVQNVSEVPGVRRIITDLL